MLVKPIIPKHSVDHTNRRPRTRARQSCDFVDDHLPLHPCYGNSGPRRSDDKRFVNHSPTLHFVAVVSGLTIASGLFSLSLTWCTCLVKYCRVVDLLGIMLNLAAGSVSVCFMLASNANNCKLLSMKAKWMKKGFRTQNKLEEMYNGPKNPECGEESKLSWVIGDECESMGLGCRFNRTASALCLLVVASLLVNLAFDRFVKRNIWSTCGEGM